MEWLGLQRGARRLLNTSEQNAMAPSGDLPVAGDKFFESRPPHHVWIVTKVYQPPSSRLPHVLLDRCGKFPASKLLSTEALLNTQLFRKDRRDPFDRDNGSDKRRRSNDRLNRG